MFILTLNCWSYSVKYHLFDWEQRCELARGVVDRVTVGDTSLVHQLPDRPSLHLRQDCPDHEAAIELILSVLTSKQHGVLQHSVELAAIGHRVVHGGEEFTRSVAIDSEVLRAIEHARILAPLHNGPNIAGIRAARDLLPNIPHVAIFDTAFHQTMPRHAFTYAVPYEWYEKYRVRRYGFHGPSHLYMSKRAAALLQRPAAKCNLVTIHLDRGVSLCAIRDGLAIDTSMGLTPLEGMVMETRCGDIDPGIPPFLMQECGFSSREVEILLNQESGLAGISGRSLSRQEVFAQAAGGDENCQLAVNVEGWRMRKYIGSYLAALGRTDAIVFSAGDSDYEWQRRENALQGLEWLGIRIDPELNRSVEPGVEKDISAVGSTVRVLVIPSHEEQVFAEDTAAIVSGNFMSHLQFPYTFSGDNFVPARFCPTRE